MIDFLKSLPLTFYSVPFYQTLVKSGKNIGLGFLLVATFLNLFQLAFSFTEPVRAFLDEREAIFESLPAIKIQNGKLETDPPAPVEIKFLEKVDGGPIRIVFDMSSERTDADALGPKMDEEKIAVMATKDKIIIRDFGNKKSETTEVQTLQDTEITHEKWREIGNFVASLFLPSLAAFSTGFLFLSHLLTAFFGGVLLFIMAPFFKLDVPFVGLLRLAAAAKVPVAVVSLFASGLPLIHLLLWFGFAAFGLLACRKAAS